MLFGRLIGLWLPFAALALAATTAAPSGPHEPVRLVDERFVRGPSESEEEISDITGYCLSCHDEFSVEADERPGGIAHNNHPVDRPYPRDPRYIARDALDERLLLVGGRVTCFTCHDHDAADHRLRISTANGELCLACHVP